MKIHSLKLFLILLYSTTILSCRKLVEIDLPGDQLTTSKVFADSSNATSAVLGTYTLMINAPNQFSVANGAITLFTGLTSDELTITGSNQDDLRFYNVSVLPDGGKNASLWIDAYRIIYQVNACIEGLNGSSSLSNSLKDQLIGECKLVRAFMYFNLVNIYGAVPLVLQTDFNITRILPRTSIDSIYSSMIIDLLDARQRISLNYVTSGRVRPNKMAATALLSRVYMYKQDWANARLMATEVINSSFYQLEPINSVFLAASREAIWQLRPVAQGWETAEGQIFNPSAAASIRPPYPISSGLYNSFEPGDLRRVNNNWVKSKTVAGQVFNYSHKYKLRMDNNINPLEHYMVLRLAEQILVRAEANIQLNDLGAAQADLNRIRNRAGLSNTIALTRDELLGAIEQERRVELFCEWGHRFFDLKRWNKANAILSVLKGANWQATDQLYPIPQNELNLNPFLVQNPGY